MTALKDAFSQAGWEERTPRVRLRRMMEQAIRDGGGLADRVPTCFTAALDRANDIHLLWELFAPVSDKVIKRFFEETLAEMRAHGAYKVGDGEAVAKVPQGHLAGASPPPPDADGPAIYPMPDGQSGDADPPATDTEAGANNRLPQGRATSAPASVPRPKQQPSLVLHTVVSKLAANEMMQQFQINGRPIADVTAGEARSWVRQEKAFVSKRAHECRWIEGLVQGLADSLVIGRCRTEDEAELVWKTTARPESDDV